LVIKQHIVLFQFYSKQDGKKQKQNNDKTNFLHQKKSDVYPKAGAKFWIH